MQDQLRDGFDHKTIERASRKYSLRGTARAHCGKERDLRKRFRIHGIYGRVRCIGRLRVTSVA